MRLGVGLGLDTAASGWTPRKLNTLAAWLAPSGIASSSGSVTSWLDHGPRGLALTAPGTAPTLTANAVNGQSAVSFNGSRCLAASGSLLSTAYTFAVVQSSTAASGGAIAQFGDSASGVDLLQATNRTIQHDGVADITGGSLPTSTWEVWIATFDGTNVALTVNGAAKTLSSPTSAMITPGGSSKLTVGGMWQSSGSSFNTFGTCQVAEVVLCSSALTGAALAHLTAYLRRKYAL